MHTRHSCHGDVRNRELNSFRACVTPQPIREAGRRKKLVHPGKRLIAIMLCMLPAVAMCPGSAATATEVAPPATAADAPAADAAGRTVIIDFVHSPRADWLYYVLARNHGRFPALDSAAPLHHIPPLAELLTLPEIAAASGAVTLEDLLVLAEDYRSPDGMMSRRTQGRALGFGNALPSHAELHRTLVIAEPAYPAFLQYWRQQIEPLELEAISAWQAQAAACAGLDTLQRWARLPLRTDTLQVGAVALHRAASATAVPAGVYSALPRQPRLHWLLGHEATHLLVGDAIGAGWTRRPDAASVTAAFEAAGGRGWEMEEVLAVHMQVRLAQACGEYDGEVRFSDSIREDSLMRRLLVAMEGLWATWQDSDSGDLVDFLLEATRVALRSAHGL
jgi:hypothetical protein